MKTFWSPNLHKVMIGIAIVVFGAALPAQAKTPEEHGYEIAARSDRSDRGFQDSGVELTMVLRNAAGKRRLGCCRSRRSKPRMRALGTGA